MLSKKRPIVGHKTRRTNVMILGGLFNIWKNGLLLMWCGDTNGESVQKPSIEIVAVLHQKAHTCQWVYMESPTCPCMMFPHTPWDGANYGFNVGGALMSVCHLVHIEAMFPHHIGIMWPVQAKPAGYSIPPNIGLLFFSRCKLSNRRGQRCWHIIMN